MTIRICVPLASWRCWWSISPFLSETETVLEVCKNLQMSNRFTLPCSICRKALSSDLARKYFANSTWFLKNFKLFLTNWLIYLHSEVHRLFRKSGSADFTNFLKCIPSVPTTFVRYLCRWSCYLRSSSISLTKWSMVLLRPLCTALYGGWCYKHS